VSIVAVRAVRRTAPPLNGAEEANTAPCTPIPLRAAVAAPIQTPAIAAMTEAGLEKAVTAARTVAPCKNTKDPDAWFPGLGDHPSSDEAFTREQARARALCAGCPVTAECLQLSLLVEQGEYGVWGAHSEWERRAMRIELARQRFAATRSAGNPVDAPQELAAA
jgi:hypothetical protein